MASGRSASRWHSLLHCNERSEGCPPEADHAADTGEEGFWLCCEARALFRLDQGSIRNLQTIQSDAASFHYRAGRRRPYSRRAMDEHGTTCASSRGFRMFAELQVSFALLANPGPRACMIFATLRRCIGWWHGIGQVRTFSSCLAR